MSLPDPALESAVRSALGNTNGPLTTADMLGLTNLTSWVVITNLSGLEYARNLQDLRLYSGNPSTVSPLAGLVQLRSLSLERVGSQDFSALSGLTALTNLDLYLSSLTNASCLAALTNLISLDLSWTRLSDPGPLAGLPHLRYLDLSGDSLGNCAALAGLTNLSGSLYLDNASLTNVEGLGGLKNLTELTLYQDQVTDLAPLANLTSLASLDLGDDPVRGFSALAGLINLQTLYLEGTAITNLNRVPLPPRLAVLDVNYNRLSDLNVLAAFTNLQWLNASYNCLTNIDALTNLSHLTTAYLQINLLDTDGGSANMNAIQALLSNGAAVYYTPQHGPPVISLPDHWLVPASETSSLWLYVSDDLTSGEHVVVSVRSSNPGLVTAVTGLSPLSAFPVQSQVINVASGAMVPNAPEIRGWGAYLNLTAVPNQTGTATITVTATDDTGLSTDAAMAVTVSQPASFDGYGVGGSSSNVSWRTFGASPWQGQTNVVHTGGSAAQSGSGESWLEADVTGPGLLTFWWRCSTTNSGSYGGYGGDARLTATCAEAGLTGHAWMTQGSLPAGTEPSDTLDWQPSTLSLPSGSWVLRWQLTPPPGGNSEVLWVADVSFAPGPPACWLETASAPDSQGYFSLYLHGPPGEIYDVEASPDLRQWFKLNRTPMYDFQVWFTDTNATAAARFYRMRESTLAPIWLEQPRLDGNRMVQLTLHSEPEQPLSIESSTNLLSWETLVQTNNWEGIMQVADGPAANSSPRFYRAKAMPWGRLTLVGSPGLVQAVNPRRHQRLALPIGR